MVEIILFLLISSIIHSNSIKIFNFPSCLPAGRSEISESASKLLKSYSQNSEMSLSKLMDFFDQSFIRDSKTDDDEEPPTL